MTSYLPKTCVRVDFTIYYHILAFFLLRFGLFTSAERWERCRQGGVKLLERDILSIDELKQRARNLALENVAVYQKSGKTPFRNLKKAINQLSAYNRELLIAENAGFYVLPAMEWLMDHIDFLKEQNFYIRKNLSASYYKRLPKFDIESSRTRISVVLKNFLQNIGGQANVTLLLEYLQAYQEVAPLTIGELWAIPLLLRISLIEEICDLFEEFYKRHLGRVQAEELLLKWEPYLSQPDKLNAVMDRTTSRIKGFPAGPGCAFNRENPRLWGRGNRYPAMAGTQDGDAN